MIITCPNCATRYNIQPSLVGEGRNTRCFNCGHSWFHGPVVSPPPPPMRPPPAPQEQSQVPMTPDMASAEPYSNPPQLAHVQMAQLLTQLGMQQNTQTETTSGTKEDLELEQPKSQAEEEDPSPKSGDESSEDRGTAPSENNQIDKTQDLVGEDIDAALAEDADTEPVESLIPTADTDGDDTDDDLDIDDLPGLDEIPEVFSPDDGGSAKTSQPRSSIKLIVIGIVVLTVAVCATLFFARNMVMDLLPVTEEIYKSVGFGRELGAGLKISEATPKRGKVLGKDALIVTGIITNVSQELRSVPMIKVALRNGEDQEIQAGISAPLKSELKAGERVKFKVVLIKPSPLARRVEVIFAPAKGTKDVEKVD